MSQSLLTPQGAAPPRLAGHGRPLRPRLALPASAQVKSLEILVPAAPGGGWDQTARAMQTALQEEKLATRIQVVNIAGAGGTIGLAQFVT